MSKFHVSKAEEITAPVDEVFATVRNFRKWPSWSSWLIAESECDVTFDENGSGYRWDGKFVGSGEMKLSGEIENERIEFDLHFLKPWESDAEVTMRLVEERGPDSPSTRIVWEMSGALRFFLVGMKKSMSASIGMDYETGLAMLKDKLEQGRVPFPLTFSIRGR